MFATARYKTWLIWYCFFLLREWSHINEVSELLKNTRESSGVSLEEVSKDIDIPVLILNQIEDGSMGAFKDIFELKKYLNEYSKYLGLNPDEIIDNFNEYMFEKTSKIPLEKIEKAAKDTMEIEANDTRIASPYTKSAPKSKTAEFIITLIIVAILAILAVIWSIKQITIGNTTTNILDYFTK